MLVDIHEEGSYSICGITLFVHQDLSDKEAERLANEICEEAKAQMKIKRRAYHEHLKWKRFFNYCKPE